MKALGLFLRKEKFSDFSMQVATKNGASAKWSHTGMRDNTSRVRGKRLRFRLGGQADKKAPSGTQTASCPTHGITLVGQAKSESKLLI
jgi:hypothetical protein